MSETGDYLNSKFAESTKRTVGNLAYLTFNMLEETLEGQIDGVILKVPAAAGGCSGSKARPPNWITSGNPFVTSVFLQGPLPIGCYSLEINSKHPKWIYLRPSSNNEMFGRSEFYIHPRGPKGSEGCIVPFPTKSVNSMSTVNKIRLAVENRSHRKLPKILLDVIAVGDTDRKLFAT